MPQTFGILIFGARDYWHLRQFPFGSNPGQTSGVQGHFAADIWRLGHLAAGIWRLGHLVAGIWRLGHLAAREFWYNLKVKVTYIHPL